MQTISQAISIPHEFFLEQKHQVCGTDEGASLETQGNRQRKLSS
jgi:hypothetical protein